MKNSHRGSAALVILIIIGIVVIGSATYYYQANQVLPDTGTHTATSTDQTKGWETYTSTQYRFSIQYPAVGGVTDMGNGKFIVGVQSNSSQNQRKLTIEVKPSVKCSDTASGVDFIVYNLDRILSGGQPPYVTAREYCTVRNGNEYKLTTQVSYTGTPIQVENDSILNATLSTFKFMGTSSATTKHSITVIYPKGGEVFHTGQKVKVLWGYVGDAAPGHDVTGIFTLVNGGKNFGDKLINLSLGDSAGYEWTVPDMSSWGITDGFQIAISEYKENGIIGKSGKFRIVGQN
jgi:hypothetical protein